MTINSFLQERYRQLQAYTQKENKESPIYLVLGNQSADMDSIASSIAYAYASQDKGFYIPFVNIPKEDLGLRSDVQYVLESLQINIECLLFLEHYPLLEDLSSQGMLKVVLVDHNHLPPGQKLLKDHVEAIIDHHKDEKVFYPRLNENDKIITTVGSNSTLIAKSLLEANPEALNCEIAYLLLSAILLDTGNLKNNTVTTSEDIRLSEVLKYKAGNYSRSKLYETLLSKRLLATHLTPAQLLKKDYKLYQEGNFLYGIASIPKGIDWNPINNHDWKAAVENLVKSQQIDFVSIFGYQGNSEIRTFIVYAPNPEAQKEIIKHFESSSNLDLGLILNNHLTQENLLFYTLEKALTRKQLQPLLNIKNINLPPLLK